MELVLVLLLSRTFGNFRSSKAILCTYLRFSFVRSLRFFILLFKKLFIYLSTNYYLIYTKDLNIMHEDIYWSQTEAHGHVPIPAGSRRTRAGHNLFRHSTR